MISISSVKIGTHSITHKTVIGNVSSLFGSITSMAALTMSTAIPTHTPAITLNATVTADMMSAMMNGGFSSGSALWKFLKIFIMPHRKC